MKKIISLVIISVMLMVMISGCTKDKVEEKGKISIVTTTTMLKDLVNQIGGDKVDVVGLMGPGIDPHLYKASAGDVTKMQNADIIIYNGVHLEGKMGDIFENLKKTDRVTLAVGNAIDEEDLISSEDFEGNHDPHIWFNLNIWTKVTEIVADKLSEFDPDNKDYYIKNGEEYAKKLQEVDQFIRERINEVSEQSRILITAHDAFNYFGNAYGFEVRGLQGISTQSEAGTGDVSKLAQFIVDKKIKAIFIESSVPERNVKALQEAVKAKGFNVEIGGELFSDSTGSAGTEEETLIGTVKHNINTIVDALK